MLMLSSCLAWKLCQLIFAEGFAYLPVVLTNLKSGLASLLGLLEISNLSVFLAGCVLSGQWGKGKILFCKLL